MADDTSLTATAVTALTGIFAKIASAASDMTALESDCIDLGHECIACALGRVLEALNDELMVMRPGDLSVHDKRMRSLATEVGSVSFLVRRYRDEFGLDACLLADRLGILYGACISPGVVEFLSWAASMSEGKRAAREKQIRSALDRGGAGRMLESKGKGYLPPHRVDTKRLDGGKAYTLYWGMSNMDQGI